MRGKVRQEGGERICYRITPAYAGKSDLKPCSWQRIGDHPRLCGEKPAISCAVRTCAGSPPPMRGKDFPHLHQILQGRITPAYAGKRYPYCSRTAPCTDHPRLCGEKSLIPSSCICTSGSPPPMRGKAIEGICSNHADRITPAYAGKSSISCSTSCVQ